MSSRHPLVQGFLAGFPAILAAVVACSRSKPHADGTAQPSPSSEAAKTAPSSAPVPSAARKSWFAGEWTGTYRAAAHRIELPTNRGGIPEWKADDGKAFVGTGTIELACAEDGTVSGSLHGALGEQEIRGETDAESLHARVIPKSTPPGFSGTVALARAGAEVTGDLSASSPDGRVARTAAVTLSRTTP